VIAGSGGIERSALGPMVKLDDGGQGVVYRTVQRPGVLFKEYHGGTQVDTKALEKITAAVYQLPEVQRAWLQQRAAIPTNLVFHQRQCVGFLMPEAPASFREDIGGKSKLLELQYLIYRPKPIWAHLRLPDAAGRLALLRRVAILFDQLHQVQVVIGDVSFRNLLWTVNPEPDIFLIDCDGMRLTGELPAVPSVETVDWDDPALAGRAPGLSSDRYKLGLLMHRVLTGTPDTRPASPRVDVEGQPIAPELLSLLDKVKDDESVPRPLASEWLQTLEGRPRIPLLPVKQRRPRQSAEEPQRPMIRVKPPAA
jgi:DNA-binding helix-hairpin-helix protein with protein kinase domain